VPPLAIERDVTDSALRLTAQLPGFDAKGLEVAIGIDGRYLRYTPRFKSPRRYSFQGREGHADC